MRAVVDTNVLISAVIVPHGSVGPVILRLRQGDFTLFYEDSLLVELVDVLNRPRIRQKYHLDDYDIATIVGLILLRGEEVTPVQQIVACRDPNDDKLLEAAIAGQADVIVSGDEDLLMMNLFSGIPIVSPRAFLKMLE